MVAAGQTSTREHVQLTISPATQQQIVAAVAAVGGEITGSGNDGTVLQGWLPRAALQTIAARQDVFRIRRPAIADQAGEVTAGNLTTEGLGLMNGPAWHTAGYTGAGVRIGVIDTAFAGYAPLLGSELPAQVNARNFVDGQTLEQFGNGDDPHGTACAEIIHDIAPNAALLLAKIQTQLDLEEAVDWLIAQQVDVISTSTLWWNETPGDGTGWLANVVRRAQNAGILFVAAAGNERQLHWGGTFFDPDPDIDIISQARSISMPLSIPHKNPEEFALIPAGTTIQLYLRWDDWTQVIQDYDLHLVQSFDGSNGTSSEAARIDKPVASGQTPTEQILWTTTGAPAYYGVMITRFRHHDRSTLSYSYAARTCHEPVLIGLCRRGVLPIFPMFRMCLPSPPFARRQHLSSRHPTAPKGQPTVQAAQPAAVDVPNQTSPAIPMSRRQLWVVAIAGLSARRRQHHMSQAQRHSSSRPIPVGHQPRLKTFLRGRATDLGANGPIPCLEPGS